MKPVLVVCFALLTCTTFETARSADPAFPIANGFGFDWLAPEPARCVRISDAEAKKLKTCEFHATGAFGLALAYHVCPAKPGIEYMVFKSASECQEALETMQANAP